METTREAIARSYARLGNHELIRIVGVDSRSYGPEALEVAIEELRQRGLSKPSFRASADDLGQDLVPEKAQIAGPLALGWRVPCLLFFPGLILAAWLWIYGRRQAAREARRWSFYGLAFWLGVGFVIRLLNGV